MANAGGGVTWALIGDFSVRWLEKAGVFDVYGEILGGVVPGAWGRDAAWEEIPPCLDDVCVELLFNENEEEEKHHESRERSEAGRAVRAGD